MPNPSSAKPTTAAWASGSGLPFAANLQAHIPLNEGAGIPSEARTGRLALPMISTIGSSGATGFTGAGGLRSGLSPAWIPGGCTIGGANDGYSLRFDHSNKGLLFYNCGFPTSASNGGALRTLACVFKHNINPCNRAGTFYSYPLIGCGTSGTTGLGLRGDTLTASTGDKLRLVYTGSNNVTDPVTPLEILPNRWYAVAVSIGLIASTVTTKTFYLYDLTNQQLHPASGLAVVDNVNGYLNDAHLIVNSFGVNLENPFLGEYAAISLHNEAWTAANFASYCADPWAPVRSSYTASGALTGGGGRYQDSTNNSVSVCFPKALGIGTGGGTGSPTTNLFRAGSPAITPGSAGSTQLASGAINVAGNNVAVVDTGLLAATDYWYTRQLVDGTQTLNDPPIYAKTKSKANLTLGVIGDSKMAITQVPEAIACAALADDRNLILVNWARPGSGLTVGNTNLSWQVGSVTPAANQAVSISYKNGSVTGGTFNLIFPLATPLTISGIAWNTTAAALATSLNAVLGAGSVATSGGPLNTTAITITGAGGSYQNASWPLPAFDLSGSALTGATPTVAGEPVVIGVSLTTTYAPGTTANNLYLSSKSEFARLGVTAVILENGANDTPNSAWQTALAAQVADLQSAGYATLVYPPETKRSFSYDPEPTSDATMQSFQGYIAGAVSGTNAKVASTNAFAMSAQFMDPPSMSDGLHENNSSPFAYAIGFSRYADIVAAFDPAATSGGGGGISKSRTIGGI